MSSSGCWYFIAVFLLSHSLHDKFQVARLLEHSGAEIMPATVENQIPRQTSLRPRLAEFDSNRR